VIQRSCAKGDAERDQEDKQRASKQDCKDALSG